MDEIKFTLYDAALKPINTPVKIDIVGDRMKVQFGPFTERVAPYATQKDNDTIIPLDDANNILHPNDMLHVTYDRVAPAHKQTVTIDYTNWEGERRTREIWPKEISFETSQWHPDPQWVVKAIDMEDKKLKSFAMKGIHSWL